MKKRKDQGIVFGGSGKEKNLWGLEKKGIRRTGARHMRAMSGKDRHGGRLNSWEPVRSGRRGMRKVCGRDGDVLGCGVQQRFGQDLPTHPPL